MQNLLGRLEKLRKTGEGKWQACCPAHRDKSPSLAIKHVGDGRILIHCFGGCSTKEVLDSIGLTFADIMGDKVAHYAPSMKHQFSALQGLKSLTLECSIVLDGSRQIAAGKRLSLVDHNRIKEAQAKINEILNICY